MIFVNENRFLTSLPGYITLESEGGEYYYVHKNLYDQAVILTDRYGQEIPVLRELIGGNQEYIAIQKYLQYVPDPINILGYYLALLEDDVEDFSDIIGAMDVLSSSVNLRNLIKQPLSIRSSVRVNMKFGNNYKDAWNHFFQLCHPYNGVVTSISNTIEEYGIEDEDTGISSKEAEILKNLEMLDTMSIQGAEPELTQTREPDSDGAAMSFVRQRRRDKLL